MSNRRIFKTDSSLSNPDDYIDLPRDTVDRDSLSIPLVGFNHEGYGEEIATAQLTMLENFAHTAPPPNPIEGQLWWDQENQTLMMRVGDEWFPAGRIPQLFFNDLGDVTLTDPVAEGQYLTFQDGAWRNRRPSLSFRGLSDTPSDFEGSRYLRVNNSATGLRFIRGFISSDVQGVLNIENLPMEEICEWIRDNCVDQPPEITAVSCAALSIANTTGECQGQFRVPGPTWTATSRSNSFTDNIQILDTSTSNNQLRITSSVFDNGSNEAIVRWDSSPDVAGTTELRVQYRITVTDTDTGLSASATTTCVATVNWDCPREDVNIVASSSHQGGSCTVASGQINCTVTGRASVTLDLSLGLTGPFEYRWTVNDGGGPLLIPQAGGAPVNSTTTTVPRVDTQMSGPGGSERNRTLAVTVFDLSRPAGDRLVGSRQLNPARYQFIAGETEPDVPETSRVRVRINGQFTSQRDGFSIRDVNNNLIPVSGVEAEKLTKLTLYVVREDSEWDFSSISGCDDAPVSGGTIPNPSLFTIPPDNWNYVFTVPNNDCVVDLFTARQAQEYRLTTIVPPGFSISPSYPQGILLRAGDSVNFTISQNDPSREFVDVVGCNGNLSGSGPWTYEVEMPPSDCTVTVTDQAAPIPVSPISASWSGDGSVTYLNTSNLPPCGPTPNSRVINTSRETISVTGGSGTYQVTWVDNVNQNGGSPASIVARSPASVPGTNDQEWVYSVTLGPGGECEGNAIRLGGSVTFTITDADPALTGPDFTATLQLFVFVELGAISPGGPGDPGGPGGPPIILDPQ